MIYFLHRHAHFPFIGVRYGISCITENLPYKRREDGKMYNNVNVPPTNVAGVSNMPHSYMAPVYGYGYGGYNYGGCGFALIVVLFILLIIIGACFSDYKG